MKQKLLAGAAVLLGTVLSACGGGYYGASYVGYGPPPPRYGAMGYAPGPGYVWVDGYWNRYGNDWRWNNGRWAVPPRGYHHWERSEWRHEGRSWRFHEGRWRR